LEFAQIFSTELERMGGVQVCPAVAVEALVCHNQLLIPQDVRVLGRLANADAVLIGFVREYDAFGGPSVTVSVEVHETRRMSGEPVDGRPDGTVDPVLAVERGYDGTQRSVTRQVEAFARSRQDGNGWSERPRSGGMMTNYLHFVSDRMVRDVLEALR
jgi:hypothetical protein